MWGSTVTLAAVACGYLLARALPSSGARPPCRWLAAALAPGLGLGAVSFGLFWLYHLRLDRRVLGAFLALAAAAALARVLRRRRSRGPIDSAGGSFAAGGPLAWVSAGLVGITVLMLGFQAAAQFEKHPLGTFDAKAIWNLHAAFLYRAETGHQELFQSLRVGNPAYPLLLPGAVAGQFLLRGSDDPAIPQATTVVLLAGLALVVGLATARLGARRLALPAVLLVLSTPAVSRFAFSQCADLPVAYLLLASAFGLAVQLDRREQTADFPPLLTGCFLGMLAWTKDEGMVLAAILVGVFAPLYWISGRRAGGRRRWLALAAGALPFLVSWATFKFRWAPVSHRGGYLGDMWAKLADPERWSEIAGQLLCRLDPFCAPERWGALGVFLLAGSVLVLITRGALTLRTAYLGLAFAAALGAYVGFYLFTPLTLRYHLESSLDRLLLQIFPLCVVWVCAALGSARGDPSRAAPERPA
jgi:hypothetical protein